MPTYVLMDLVWSNIIHLNLIILRFYGSLIVCLIRLNESLWKIWRGLSSDGSCSDHILITLCFVMAALFLILCGCGRRNRICLNCILSCHACFDSCWNLMSSLILSPILNYETRLILKPSFFPPTVFLTLQTVEDFFYSSQLAYFPLLNSLLCSNFAKNGLTEKLVCSQTLKLLQTDHIAVEVVVGWIVFGKVDEMCAVRPSFVHSWVGQFCGFDWSH